MIDETKILENAIRDGLRDGVKEKLSRYGGPLESLVEAAVKSQSAWFRSLFDEAVESCKNDPAFREQIAQGVRHTLAKTLVARYGGELEKQVNTLKSDPVTRAKITLAIEEIVKQKT